MSTVVRNRKRGFTYDWLSIGLYISLVLIGWLMIYAVGHNSEKFQLFDLNSQAGKQGMWILISFTVFTAIQFISQRFWHFFAHILYGIGLFGLILVLIVGTEIKGATSWFNIAGFSFQPSELAKFTTALGLAAYLSNFKTDLQYFKYRVAAVGTFLLPIAIILLQPDAGSALVFSSFFIVLYREGLQAYWFVLFFLFVGVVVGSLMYNIFYVMISIVVFIQLIQIFNQDQRWLKMWIWLILLIVSIFMVEAEMYWPIFIVQAIFLFILSIILIGRRYQSIVYTTWSIGIFFCSISYVSNYIFSEVLLPHQQDRINVWLQPELSDPRGSLYNLMQSKMAIGSGGFYGKGYLEGTMTKLNYVPEQSTDFIFCTIGEEFGFIGSSIIILCFLALLWRLTYIGEFMKTSFERLYTYGIAGILFLHFFVNIGMTIGLMPIIGIPLPFISYGGSSLLIFSIMLSVVIKFYSERSRI